MAIFTFAPGEDGEPTRLRVSVQINGKRRYRYFGLAGLTPEERLETLKKAHLLNEKWETEKEMAKRERHHNGDHHNAVLQMGLTGIRLTYTRAGRSPHGAPYIRASYSDKGKLRYKNYSIKKLGLDEAWRQAVEQYATWAKLPDEERQLLLGKKPSRDTCLQFQQVQQKRGYVLKTADLVRWGML